MVDELADSLDDCAALVESGGLSATAPAEQRSEASSAGALMDRDRLMDLEIRLGCGHGPWRVLLAATGCRPTLRQRRPRLADAQDAAGELYAVVLREGENPDSRNRGAHFQRAQHKSGLGSYSPGITMLKLGFVDPYAEARALAAAV